MYEMSQCSRDTWKRALLIFLTVVFVLLTAASCIFTLCRVPIYLTYEEAVADVRFEKGGYISVQDKFPTEVTFENVHMFVTVTDRVTGGSNIDGGLIYTNYRLRWWYDTQPESKLDKGVREYELHNDAWYLGTLANGDDVLLYDIPELNNQLDGRNEHNFIKYNIVYLCLGALLLGIVVAVIGLKYRQGKASRILLSIAAFLLLLSASCVFVTGGRMAYIYPFLPNRLHHYPLRSVMGFFGLKYIMILLIGMFSWGTFMSICGLVKQLRKK